MKTNLITGVYAAAVTPLQPDYSPDLKALPGLLDFLAERGCHGVLLFGTTGEGPSFSPAERLEVLRACARYRQSRPELRLLAGTGTPSLDETISLTRAAFDLGIDGVVVLPPYYYRKVSDEGLFDWYSALLKQAVPQGKILLGYHIPPVTGIGLSLDLLENLRQSFPDRFAGIKDSSADPEHAVRLGQRFGKDLLVLNGTDRLFSLALQQSAAGCITALANLCSPDLRRVWDSYQLGRSDPEAQKRLDTARTVSEFYPPAPALIKALLARQFGLPRWTVRPPLLPLPEEALEAAFAAMRGVWDV